MKRFLLLLCLLPYITFAQTSKRQNLDALKRCQSETSLIRLLSSQKSNQLDSAYTYSKTGSEDTELIEKKTYYKYDGLNRVVEELSFVDDSGLGNFNQYRSEYIYIDNSPHPSQIDQYYLQDGIWMKIIEKHLSYDNNGIPVRTYTLIADGKDFKIESSWTATAFDEKGFPNEYRDSTFKNDISVIKFEFTYNEHAQITNTRTFIPGNTNGEWIPWKKITYLLDEDGLLRLKEERFEFKQGEWDYSDMIAYEYDDRGQLIHEKYVTTQDYTITRTQNFYSDGIVTHNNESGAESDISIRYNQGVLYIYLNDELKGNLQIFNITGQIAGQYTINSQSNIIPLDNVNKGLYIVRLQTNSGVYTQKILKR